MELLKKLTLELQNASEESLIELLEEFQIELL